MIYWSLSDLSLGGFWILETGCYITEVRKEEKDDCYVRITLPDEFIESLNKTYVVFGSWIERIFRLW